MTKTQLDLILTLSGAGPGVGTYVKSLTVGSGRTWLVQQSLTKPGSYSLVFDEVNQLALLTPIAGPANSQPITASATEYVPYDSIESIAILPLS